ncbi:MAG: hypothetical protein M3R41_09470, partial [Pseudomonadota bacterium]|nr:hypothetical protein [Pseudomonadota bacterium]
MASAPAEDDLLLIEEAPLDQPEAALPDYAVELDDEVDPPKRRWFLPTLGVLVSLGWLGGMLYLARASLMTLAPVALVEFIAALCVPPALIAILLVLALRTSRTEARRFGDIAGAMRAESASLERAVAAMSSRIAQERQSLADQAQMLTTLGDSASERLRGVTTEMTAEARILDSISGAIGDAADRASTSLSTLFNSLPKAQAETAGLNETLQSTGLAASERIAELGAQLAALAERGRAADEIAGGAASKL